MNEIVTALHSLKLPGMAQCWTSLSETHQLGKLSLHDGMQLLLQTEKDTRNGNRIARLVKEANFRMRATIEELETNTARGVNAAAVATLATGEYINSGATVIVCGAAGTGKTFLATALGERACRQGTRVYYYTMQKLMEVVRLARLEGRETKFFERMERVGLLIIDDFGMKALEGQQQNDFEQIIDDRYHKKAIIIASQLPVSDWYPVFQSELIAEACMDRLVHKSIRFQLQGESLRKKY
ncbi:MAG: IS21-like element helper ATPase IstB [Prevotellaceae bacterium]|jgi:DNA replication protein DnaC|nr:IS21-like element helper ATPase IstB [Prevotellaceae bacterium]